jgi:hypothetical protein
VTLGETMRVYLPSTLPGLARVLAAGEIGPAPLTAFTVTPALREWYVSGDLEELEYAALTEAARASLRLLTADRDAPARRVVLAVEASEEIVTREPGDGLGDVSGQPPAAVRLTAVLPISKIASGHVDDGVAEPDIVAAREALPAADAGDEDARFVVDGAEGHELMWYATQELRYLVE